MSPESDKGSIAIVNIIYNMYVVYVYISMDTNIRVKKETRELLKDLGKMGQTYDQVINDLAKAKAKKAKLQVKEVPIAK